MKTFLVLVTLFLVLFTTILADTDTETILDEDYHQEAARLHDIFHAQLRGSTTNAKQSADAKHRELQDLETKYPIVFVPGMISMRPRFTDHPNRFQHLLATLEAAGLTKNIHVLSLGPECGSIRNCASDAKSQLLRILATTGASKLNIVGLVDGGLFVRHAISNLGIGSKVSSLTTVNTPHFGSPLFRKNNDNTYLSRFITSNLGLPNEEQYLNQLTDYAMNGFNSNTPNRAGIYYQSWSSHCELLWSNAIRNFLRRALGRSVTKPDNIPVASGRDNRNQSQFLTKTAWILHYLLLENSSDMDARSSDGISSMSSMDWGNYRGDINADHANTNTGIDAFQSMDEWGSAEGVWNFEQFYVDLVTDLRDRGY